MLAPQLQPPNRCTFDSIRFSHPPEQQQVGMWNGEEQTANGKMGESVSIPDCPCFGSGAASDSAADSKYQQGCRGRQVAGAEYLLPALQESAQAAKPLAFRQVMNIPSSSGLRQPDTLRHHPLAAAASARPRGRDCTEEIAGSIDHIDNAIDACLRPGACNRGLPDLWDRDKNTGTADCPCRK